MSPQEDEEGQPGFRALWEMGENAELSPGSEDEEDFSDEQPGRSASRQKGLLKGDKQGRHEQQEVGKKSSGSKSKGQPGAKKRSRLLPNCDDVTIFPRRKAGQDKLGSNRPPIVISRQVLESYFDMPQQAVCKKLGICATVIKRVCRQLGIDKWPYKGNKIDLRKRGLGPAARKDFFESSPTPPPRPVTPAVKSASPSIKRAEPRMPAHRQTESPSVRSASDSDTGFSNSSAFEHRNSPPTVNSFGDSPAKEASTRRAPQGMMPRQEQRAPYAVPRGRFERPEMKRDTFFEESNARISALYADLRNKVLDRHASEVQMQLVMARNRSVHERNHPASVLPSDIEEDLQDGCDLAWLVGTGRGGEERREYVDLEQHDIFAQAPQHQGYYSGPGNLSF